MMRWNETEKLWQQTHTLKQITKQTDLSDELSSNITTCPCGHSAHWGSPDLFWGHILFLLLLLYNCTIKVVKWKWEHLLQKIMILGETPRLFWNNYHKLLSTKWSTELWKSPCGSVRWNMGFWHVLLKKILPPPTQFHLKKERKYYDIQVWVRGPLLWWKPTWFPQRSVEVRHILIERDYRAVEAQNTEHGTKRNFERARSPSITNPA